MSKKFLNIQRIFQFVTLLQKKKKKTKLKLGKWTDYNTKLASITFLQYFYTFQKALKF